MSAEPKCWLDRHGWHLVLTLAAVAVALQLLVLALMIFTPSIAFTN